MKILVAYSGGLDSHCLLHMLVNNVVDKNIFPRSDTPYESLAVYINHGLSPHADAWQQHCANVASQLGMDFTAIKINVNCAAGDSLEAAARTARYAAFANLMQADDVLLTAHHQDDQAETFLLQALRGSGVKGLAAMPMSKPFASGRHIRPLLNKSRAELVDYAQQQDLQWIEDESNTVQSFARNYLRHTVMPTLQHRWPSMSQSLAQSSAYCAEAVELNTALGALDLVNCLTSHHSLEIAALLSLSLVRQKNVLRHWLAQRHCSIPSGPILERILTEVIPAAEDAMPLVDWSGGAVRRFQQELYALAPTTELHYESCVWLWQTALALHEEELVGILAAQGVVKQNLPEQLTVTFRQAGDKIKLWQQPQTKSLKKLFQAWGVPPWKRAQVPLVFAYDQLLAAPPYYHAEEPASIKGDRVRFILRNVV